MIFIIELANMNLKWPHSTQCICAYISALQQFQCVFLKDEVEDIEAVLLLLLTAFYEYWTDFWWRISFIFSFGVLAEVLFLSYLMKAVLPNVKMKKKLDDDDAANPEIYFSATTISEAWRQQELLIWVKHDLKWPFL